MGRIGNETESIKCVKCNNIVNAKVISEYLGTPSIKGTTVNKTIKLDTHKNNGFFSRKCIKSGSLFTVSYWHPSNKVKKTKCKYCKKDVAAFILNEHSRNNGYRRPVTKQITITVLKLLHHKKGQRKCYGVGKIVKEKHVDLIDNCHP